MCFKSLTALLIHRKELHISFDKLGPLQKHTKVRKTITNNVTKEIYKQMKGGEKRERKKERKYISKRELLLPTYEVKRTTKY